MSKITKVLRPQVAGADNVEYQLRHCDACANGTCPILKAYQEALDRGDGNVKWTPHGEVKPIFQENVLCKILLKKGLLSPLWINRRSAFLIAPFLGSFSTSKVIGNLIPNAGLAGIAARINGSGSPAAFTYIAVGTGTTAAASGDTALQTETATSGLARAAGTVSTVQTTVSGDTAQVTHDFSVTGTVAITEAGLLNAASGGTLAARQVFTAVNVSSGDTFTATWKIQAS